jgi:hypothetical protein
VSKSANTDACPRPRQCQPELSTGHATSGKEDAPGASISRARVRTSRRAPRPRVPSHCRFTNSGTESLSKSGIDRADGRWSTAAARPSPTASLRGLVSKVSCRATAPASGGELGPESPRRYAASPGKKRSCQLGVPRVWKCNQTTRVLHIHGAVVRKKRPMGVK